MQADGNLVLYDNNYNPHKAIWATHTNGSPANVCYMDPGGDLILYANNNSLLIWASNTPFHPGSYLVVQDDGNMVIYLPSAALWATNTVGQ